MAVMAVVAAVDDKEAAVKAQHRNPKPFPPISFKNLYFFVLLLFFFKLLPVLLPLAGIVVMLPAITSAHYLNVFSY